MENKVARSSNDRNTIMTDLRLLLECLKFQMKSPDLQKQALLAIHSICDKREDAVDILREMGGVAFVHNLSRSNVVQACVKETALFTLCTVAEASVYCKNSLCRKETFAQLAGLLIKEDTPLSEKRVSVYLLSVLVTNNKSGQTLAQITGCLDTLLDLFRTTLPLSVDDAMRRPNSQSYQLWVSVSNALCGCVNNPQNEESQRICVANFPIIKIWLQQISLPRTEILQPICSFIAMTVANNSCVQESFSASGALYTICRALIHQASAAATSLLSYQLSVTLSKTLSACIADNSPLAAGLAKYGVVPHLFSVLSSPHLQSEDRLSVLLTLSHCTESSEEHQSQLVHCGGLPLIITLLTEDASEETRKAATFILQTCRQATTSLAASIARQGEGENEEHLADMDHFRTSARELLHRIDLLEKRQAKEAKDEQEAAEPAASSAQPGHPQISSRGVVSIERQLVKNVMKNETDKVARMSSKISLQEEKAESSRGGVRCLVCKGTGAVMSFHQLSLEGVREPHPEDNQFFKTPEPTRHSVPKEISSAKRRLQVHESPMEEHPLSHIRCAGCVLSFEEVTSRTFTSLQSSCHHKCDMHKALQEATEQYRKHQFDLLFNQFNAVAQTNPDSHVVSAAEPQRSCNKTSKVSLTPLHKPAEHLWKKNNRNMEFNLIPLNRGAKESGLSSTPLKMSQLRGERREEVKKRHHDYEPKTGLDHSSAGRERKDFSCEELRYLLHGVKTYGFSWNAILWSYPFKPGRTNISLARKYKQLMKVKAQDCGCT